MNIPEARERDPYEFYQCSECNGERHYTHTTRYREEHSIKIGGAAAENERQNIFLSRQQVPVNNMKQRFRADEEDASSNYFVCGCLGFLDETLGRMINQLKEKMASKNCLRPYLWEANEDKSFHAYIFDEKLKWSFICLCGCAPEIWENGVEMTKCPFQS